MKSCLIFVLSVMMLFSTALAENMDTCSVSSRSIDLSPRIVSLDGEIYCVSNDVLFSFVNSIYHVTADKIVRIARRSDISGLYAWQNTLLIERHDRLITDYLTKGRGTTALESYSLQNNTGVIWYTDDNDIYFPYTFVANDTFYLLTHNDDKTKTLSYFIAPKEPCAIMTIDEPCNIYPSFLLLSMKKTGLFSNRSQITLYDYQSGTIYETKNGLLYSERTIDFHGIFRDEKLYYLSGNDVRCYNFADDMDNELLTNQQTKEASYFLLLDDQIVLLGAPNYVDFYDMASGKLQCQYMLDEYLSEAIIVNDVLYAYSPYQGSSLEVVELNTDTHHLYNLKN